MLVEQFIAGSEHRLLVVGGRMVAAIRGEIVTIRGDGQSSVAQLIESQLNTDPRRGPEEEFPLDTILLDDNPVACMELARQGLDGNSIPAPGIEIVVQRTGNMVVDVTDEVHPDVAATAVLAARVVGLDIAGIDLVAEDISKPLADQRGAIVEVNAGPGLLMHPSRALANRGQSARRLRATSSPSMGAVAFRSSVSAAPADAARLRAWLPISSASKNVLPGSPAPTGPFLASALYFQGNHDRHASGRQLLMNPRVEAAVIENGPLSILDDGLAYDRCQIGIVTNLHDPARFGARIT